MSRFFSWIFIILSPLLLIFFFFLFGLALGSFLFFFFTLLGIYIAYFLARFIIFYFKRKRGTVYKIKIRRIY